MLQDFSTSGISAGKGGKGGKMIDEHVKELLLKYQQEEEEAGEIRIFCTYCVQSQDNQEL